jgi:transcriptional regulator with XRE-family HTH domain
MDDTDGKVLVAAYLKQLRLARGIEQVELAEKLGVHKSTVLRAEHIKGRESSGKMDNAIAMARALGGDEEHVRALWAGSLPAGYPLERMGHASRHRTATIEAAADVAKWHVEEQDRRLSEAAERCGLKIAGLSGLLRSLLWALLAKPDLADDVLDIIT